MGDPKFCKKKYQKPHHPWQAERIKLEVELTRKYGLANKREIWKMESFVRNLRARARKVVGLRGEDHAEAEKALVGKLRKIGILEQNSGIDDVLGLDVKVIMEKRLQTTIFKMGLAASVKQARQLITHKKITVNGEVINAPAYLVKVGDRISTVAGFKIKNPTKSEGLIEEDTLEKPMKVVQTKEGPKIEEVKSEEDLEKELQAEEKLNE